jgi:hypothetical protein
LPLPSHLTWQPLKRNRLDDQAENAFVQALCEQEFGQTPFGRQPSRRNQKQNRLTSIGSSLQRFLPPFARRKTAFGIDVEKNLILEALFKQPIAQCNGRGIVCTRMTYK